MIFETSAIISTKESRVKFTIFWERKEIKRYMPDGLSIMYVG